MLTPGHIASSYLLAQSTRIIGYNPSPNEIMLVIVMGNIVDFFTYSTNVKRL